MKKALFIFLFLYPIINFVLAQSPMEIMKNRQEEMKAQGREYNEGKVDTAHRFFYKTYADFLANKFVTAEKYVGKRKILLHQFRQIVDSNDCSLADFSVPAHGLFLMDVKYHDVY